MKTSKIVILALLSLIFFAASMQMVQASCSLLPTTNGENITTLSSLLPGDARGALAVDLNGLLAGSSATQVTALLSGSGDPALSEPLSAINELAENVDLANLMNTALLVQTTDLLDGPLLLAIMSCDTVAEITAGPALTPDGTYGTGAHALYLDVNGNSLSLLTGGVLIVGKLAAVQSVLDVVDGATADAAIDPFLSALQSGSPFSFVYGLPAMFNGAITPDDSLRGAELVSGSLAFAGPNISGSVSFHTSNAAAFVDKHNELNIGATYAGEVELALNGPIANGLSQVVVTIPSTPINKSGASLINSRNTLKKLVIGMEAWDYAKDVGETGNKPLLDFTVLSEQDGADIPGSVFIRWEIRPEKVAEFEANELPAGFTLADLQFLESDSPGKFLALNLYDSGGGAVVSGARAEWNFFVNPPVGADPDAGTRPRFMVIDALAEGVSADAVHGLTPAEPCDHYFDGNQVVSSIAKYDTDGVTVIPVFWSSFPKPNPLTAPIARLTRETAAANDYIYWGHGVYDRVQYNASAFNNDSYFADVSQVQITDLSHWKQYLADDPTYVVYLVNTLEYIGTPWDNLDSPYLDITPQWLNELKEFKYNGHELSWMTDAVENLFKGRADAPTPLVVENTTPATYYNFEITNSSGMAAALNLPAGYSLEPTHFLKDYPTEAYYLTLSVYEIKNSVEGTRAEWSVYVDDGKGREHKMVIDLQTEDAALDPVSMLNLPSMVSHDLTGGILSTTLSSSTIDFDSSFNTAGAYEEDLSLDWIEAEELVCHLNGICDKLYYNAETLDVPVHLLLSVTVTMSTPWDGFIDTTPSSVFFRDNLQEYVTKPWQNLKVYVEDPPPPPVCFEGTHTITGTGEMIGRTNPAVNSTYTYYGGGSISGNNLEFYLDQTINNILGESHILTSVSFDLTTGLGTSTLEGCTGPALMCADVNPKIGTPEGTSEYTATNLDNSGSPDNMTWEVNFELFIDGMGWADSASSLAATLGDPSGAEICSNGVDDDCDGFLDCQDSDCTSDPYCTSWLTPASVVNSEYEESSDIANYLFLLFIPVGAVLLWKGLRRKK
jgi:hypothetical protein